MPDTPAIPEELIPATRSKLKAEARAAKAKALRDAAEERALAAQARHNEAMAVMAELELERDQDRRKVELAQNSRHLFYDFTSTVSAESVAKCIGQLAYWERTEAPGQEIEIQFNSPGGGITAGLALWDKIQQVKEQHHVTTSSIGIAASMGGILLQAGHYRVIGRESWLMIHEASFGASGKTGEVEDTYEWVKAVQRRILRIFAERSTLTVEELETNWKRKDWWLDSDEAYDLGLVDAIR